MNIKFHFPIHQILSIRKRCTLSQNISIVASLINLRDQSKIQKLRIWLVSEIYFMLFVEHGEFMLRELLILRSSGIVRSYYVFNFMPWLIGYQIWGIHILLLKAG